MWGKRQATQDRADVHDAWLAAIRREASPLASYTEAQLIAAARLLRSEAGRPDSSNDLFFRSVAMAAESMQRTMGFRLHDVQLIGATATARGGIVEMQTGEGKTVVCGVAAAVRAMFDRSVHVATTNEYLAERDHAAVEGAFHRLGLTSGLLRQLDPPATTRANYRQNITYGPGYLFGFDFLRDQTRLRAHDVTTLGTQVMRAINGTNLDDQLSQLAHDSIIIDEADSVLLDEATTPLILSGGGLANASTEVEHAYELALAAAAILVEGTDYTVDNTQRRVELTPIGFKRIHDGLRDFGKLTLNQPWQEYVTNALYAARYLTRDEHYVVLGGQIQLVDQFTGRIFEDRKLRRGLHQALEAKEGVPINPPQRTLARVTRQRFFQKYATLCGLTGTAVGSEEELAHFYGVSVTPLPAHRPCQRQELADRFFPDARSKLSAIVAETVRRNRTGQPVLIGTTTIRESYLLGEALRQAAVSTELLNGIQDEAEASIVRKAGQRGAVTVATNMAGRGTDIKLADDAGGVGGLHVIGTQRQASRRIDRQLAGRSARQGDPGSAQFFLAPDDDLFTQHSKRLASRIARVPSAGATDPMLSQEVEVLQQVVARQQFEMRRMLVQHDNWLDDIRKLVANAE